MSARPAILLPVEALPEDVDPIDDAAELVPPIAVRTPQIGQRLELREIAEAVLGGLGHGHLIGDAAPIALRWRDSESSGSLLSVEMRRLTRRHRTEEEPGAEPDGTRARRDEVREIPERPEITEPSLLRQQVRERLARHETLAHVLDDRCDGRHRG